MIKIYGIAGSRARRSLWAIEEVGVEYEHVQTSFMDDSKTAEYLSINPNGRVPALLDGDLALFESMAINLYLANKYGGDLYPRTKEDEARAIQWSFWGITELEPHLIQMVMHKMFLPEAERSPQAIEAAEQALERPLPVLDAALAEHPYLLGDSFTIADLNVAGVLSTALFAGYDYSKHANVQRWAEACLSREAFVRTGSL